MKWEIRFDEASGRPFYIDHVARVTTWERPQEFTDSVSINNNYNYNNNTETETDEVFARRLQEEEDGAVARALANESTSLSDVPPSSSLSANISSLASASTSSSTKQLSSARSPPSLLNPPQIKDFEVEMIPDQSFASCQSCFIIFSNPLRRRHHCRLCGNIFCEACSKTKVMLPLEGVEFEKPVRICSGCLVDVAEDNYFSLRRYLTVFSLPSPSLSSLVSALHSFTQDLSAILLNPPENNSTNPLMALSKEGPKKVLKVLCSHLESNVGNDADSHLLHGQVVEHVNNALCTLLAVANLVGDLEFAKAATATPSAVNGVLAALGSSRSTEVVQTSAAKSLFYMTVDAAVHDEDEAKNGGDSSFPISRAITCILESVTSPHLSLQRWSAACIRNILLLSPKSLSPLVTSGGVLVLASLLGSGDDDSRIHGAGALLEVVRVSGYEDSVLKQVCDAINFDEAVPSLLRQDAHSDPRMADTALNLVASLLRRIFYPDSKTQKNTEKNAYLYTPSYTTAKKLFTVPVMRALAAVLSNQASNHNVILTIIASIYQCNAISTGNNPLVSVCKHISDLAIGLLNRTNKVDESRQRIVVILTKYTTTIAPTQTLTTLLNHGLLLPAQTLIHTHKEDEKISELVLVALDANVISQISKLFSTKQKNATLVALLLLLLDLATAAYEPKSSRNDEPSTSQRFSDSFFHFSQNNLTMSIIETLRTAVDATNNQNDTNDENKDIVSLALSFLTLLSRQKSATQGLEEITQNLFLSTNFSNVITNLLVSSPSSLLPVLRLTTLVTANCQLSQLPKLSETNYQSIVVDILSNTLTANNLNHDMCHEDEEIVGLCLTIVNHTAPFAPPSDHIVKACSVISQALTQTNHSSSVRSSCMKSLSTLAENSNNNNNTEIISKYVFPSLAEILQQSESHNTLISSALEMLRVVLPLGNNVGKAANSGLLFPLTTMIIDDDGGGSKKFGIEDNSFEAARLALEILLTMATNDERVIKTLISQGALHAVCQVLLKVGAGDCLLQRKKMAIELLIVLVNDKDRNSRSSIVEQLYKNMAVVVGLCRAFGGSLQMKFGLETGLFDGGHDDFGLLIGADKERISKLLWTLVVLFSDREVAEHSGSIKFWSILGLEDLEMQGRNGANANICALAICGTLLSFNNNDDSNTAKSTQRLIKCSSHALKGRSWDMKTELILERCNFFAHALENEEEVLLNNLITNYPELCVREFLGSEKNIVIVLNMLGGYGMRGGTAALAILNEAITNDSELFCSRLVATNLKGRAISVICSTISESKGLPEKTEENLSCLTMIVRNSLSGEEALEIATKLNEFLASKILEDGAISESISELTRHIMGKKETNKVLMSGNWLKGVVRMVLDDKGGEKLTVEVVRFLTRVCENGDEASVDTVVKVGGHRVCLKLANEVEECFQLIGKLIRGNTDIGSEMFSMAEQAMDIVVVGGGDRERGGRAVDLLMGFATTTKQSRDKIVRYEGLLHAVCESKLIPIDACCLLLTILSVEIDERVELEIVDKVGLKFCEFLLETKSSKDDLVGYLKGLKNILEGLKGRKSNLYEKVLLVLVPMLNDNTERGRESKGVFDSFVCLLVLNGRQTYSDCTLPLVKMVTGQLIDFVIGLDRNMGAIVRDERRGDDLLTAKLFAAQCLLLQIERSLVQHEIIEKKCEKSFKRAIEKIGGALSLYW